MQPLFSFSFSGGGREEVGRAGHASSGGGSTRQTVTRFIDIAILKISTSCFDITSSTRCQSWLLRMCELLGQLIVHRMSWRDLHGGSIGIGSLV